MSDYFNVADIFGENVFNDTVMQERLPKKVYKKLHEVMDEGKELDLETADEITDVFARYLPIATTRQLRNLLTEHIEIAGQIIQALKAKNMSDYDALVKEWYRNANQMAALFANYNPYFESRETRNMLLNHLDLTREEIEHQVNGEYEQSIDVFRDVEQQALALADYFARGLLAR